MFTLKLLGGACVEGPEGPLTGRVAQRRRVAVLALLAMSRRQGLGREKLAATLWPESDGDRARHLLSDTVYVINRALGSSDGGDVVIAGAGELRLRAGAVECDARAFEDAVDSGALEEAVRLYTGPFLDGFFVDGSEEFERWTCAERERLQDLYSRALERLATARDEGGDLRGALEGWRRLAAADPLNSRVACRVAETLDRTGDRAGALTHLRTHVATLKEELGIAPPADVTTLLRALRAPAAQPAPNGAAAADAVPAGPEALRAERERNGTVTGTGTAAEGQGSVFLVEIPLTTPLVMRDGGPPLTGLPLAAALQKAALNELARLQPASLEPARIEFARLEPASDEATPIELRPIAPAPNESPRTEPATIDPPTIEPPTIEPGTKEPGTNARKTNERKPNERKPNGPRTAEPETNEPPANQRLANEPPANDPRPIELAPIAPAPIETAPSEPARAESAPPAIGATEAGGGDCLPPPAPAPPTAGADFRDHGRRTRPTRPIVWTGMAALGVLVLVTLLVVMSRGWSDPAVAVTTSRAVRSVAVMPFVDLSPGRDHEYFGEGTAEELSTRLARVPGLKVAARGSAFAFKDGRTDAKAIGRALSVDALLEGSVRQEKGRVRIAVRLVDARDGYQMWADTWECDGDKVMAMQDDIATDVLAVLRAAAAPAPSDRPAALPAAATSTSAGAPRATSAASRSPIDLAAYNLYLQGRYFWHQRTHDGLMRAAALFDRAAAISPNYAEAHSGVADAYAVLGFYDHLPPRDAFPRARTAARRALALDDRLAAAYASLGYVALYYDWDWAAAERELDRAVALNPSYSIGHQWRGNYLVARGRFDEAEAAMRRAQDVDPLSLIASAALGWVQFHARKFDAAAQQCQRTIEMNPNFVQAWQWGGSAHEGAGRYAEAIRMLTRATELSGRSPISMAALGRAYALSGDTASARRIADSLRREGAGYVPAYEMAKLHLALGDRAAALTWLRRAYDQRSHSIVFLAVDPQLDPLRADREFRDLIVRSGVGKF